MDNLIERLEYGRDHDSNMLVSCVDEAIAALRAQQWISVEDELPEADQKVAILIEGEPGWHIGMGSNDGTRILLSGFYGDFKVTHWMNLPTPPETEHEQ